jgi:hypothetical protein
MLGKSKIRLTRAFALAFASLFLAAGCAPTKSPQPSTVQIRLKNAGTVPIENIRVNFQGQTETFDTLAPGANSPYRTIAKTYRYAYIEATVAGQRAIVQPEDFVGETLLPSGKYTWTLATDPAATQPYGRIDLQTSTRDPEP